MVRKLVVVPVAQPGPGVITAVYETEIRLGLARDEVLRLLAEGGGHDAIRAPGAAMARLVTRVSFAAVLGMPGYCARARRLSEQPADQ